MSGRTWRKHRQGGTRPQDGADVGQNIYAFEVAGVDEADAQAAAEELAVFEARFASMESNISHMNGKITAIEGKINVLL